MDTENRLAAMETVTTLSISANSSDWKQMLAASAAGNLAGLINPLQWVSAFGAGENRKVLAWCEVLNGMPPTSGIDNRTGVGKPTVSGMGQLAGAPSVWEPVPPEP